MPSLDFVVRGPDMAAVHSAMIVRTLTAFGLHLKSYTIFQEEKRFGRRIDEISGRGKGGRWTWWGTTLNRRRCFPQADHIHDIGGSQDTSAGIPNTDPLHPEVVGPRTPAVQTVCLYSRIHFRYLFTEIHRNDKFYQ